MDEGETVRLAMRGNAAALSELAQRWSARLFALCLSRSGNRHVAEDLAQEALFRALSHLDSLADPDRFGPWLCGIALRVFLDWKKAKQTSQVPFSTLDANSSLDELIAAEATSHPLERADELERLTREVGQLDDDLRETLLLYYSHDMTYAQLAELLGVSAATVNARLTKARALLRTRLADPPPALRASTSAESLAPTRRRT